MFTRVIAFFIWAILAVSAKSQENVMFRVGISNEATAVPFTKFFTSPAHPSIKFGIQIPYGESNFYQTVNLGYIFHKNLYQGFYLNTEAGYDYKFDFGLNLKSLLGIGYLRTYTTRDEYQLRNGEYVNGKDKGNSRLMPSLSLGFGYRTQKNSPDSPEVFVLYTSWIEYPYSPGFIPLMSHINLEVGYKFKISNQ